MYQIELVSKELNHFGVIAGLFRQIGGHSSRFVLFCSFWRLFTVKMIKSVKVLSFSFWKLIIFFCFTKFKPLALTCKMAAKWFNSLDTNSSTKSYLASNPMFIIHKTTNSRTLKIKFNLFLSKNSVRNWSQSMINTSEFQNIF